MVRSRVSDLKSLLSMWYGDDFTILSEMYKMLTPPGEHYGSIMLALDVILKRTNGKEEVLNLVAKLIPASPMLRKSFNISTTFKNEVYAYQKVIPALIEFQQHFKIPEEDTLNVFPKCYGTRISLEPNKCEVDEDAAILFENLNLQGYAMEDRMIGFNYDTACLILKDLAKFHATALVYRLLKSDLFKQIETHISEEIKSREVSKPFSDCMYIHSAKCKQLETYLERIHIYFKKSMHDLKYPSPREDSIFKTIIHKDFWVNNVLVLRDDAGKPLKTKIVDLQLITCDSAVFDVIFFMFSSVINEVLDLHFSDLIQMYHQKFVKVLSHYEINVEPYTLAALVNEIELVAPRATFDALQILKPIFTERGKIQSTLEDFDENDWKRDDLLGDTYTRKLKDTLLCYANRNWL